MQMAFGVYVCVCVVCKVVPLPGDLLFYCVFHSMCTSM